jgi:hypothetical protein
MKILALILLALTLEANPNPNIKTTQGEFYTEFDALNCETEATEHFYQFRSDDDSVWWMLTAEEIGYIPECGKKYALTYDDKGTTTGNKTCDCLPEWECECEVYDDEFIKIEESEEKK